MTLAPSRSRVPPAPADTRDVTLYGMGVAASCHAFLLEQAGIPVRRAASRRRPVPIVMLSDPAIALLRDVFGQPDMFAGNPSIERRIVSWGGAAPVSVPHGAVAVTGTEIEQALWGGAPVCAEASEPRPADDVAWTIHAEPPFPAPHIQCFGSREATATRVTLAPGADRATCVVEATASGWLFLIPHGCTEAWLLSVGTEPAKLLAESGLVVPLVAALHEGAATFETAPRMLEALCGPGWLACGTSALAFDPICGDGTAQAVREAILGAAVLRAVQEGGDADALWVHYASMMLASMRRHLLHSLQFYRSGGDGAWWREQARALAEGHAWCTARLSRMPEPRFLLRGFDLVLREDAA